MCKELDKFSSLNVLDTHAQNTLNKKYIRMRWVHSWKLKNKIRLPKSRLVALGYADPRNCDSLDTYSGTANKDLLRMSFIYYLSRGWNIAKSDVSTAFLQAPITDEVWVKLPEMMPENSPHNYTPGATAKALKAIYGLKDAPRVYTQHIKKKVKVLGWEEIHESIFILSCPHSMKLKGIIITYSTWTTCWWRQKTHAIY
eukprot:GHVR01081938.1.p1 GENE.GHVR01081938.1~~GHVR01081938.1.p1  ORF type:complete len:199 (+),score=12.79 GHVR01081938.1:546-1142(+)